MYLIRTVRNLWREARLTCAGNSMVDGRQMPKCHGGGKDVRTTISLEDWTCRSVSRFVGRSARNGSQDARRENQRLESRAERGRGLDQLTSVSCVCVMRRRIHAVHCLHKSVLPPFSACYCNTSASNCRRLHPEAATTPCPSGEIERGVCEALLAATT